VKVLWTEQAYERLIEIEDFIAADDPDAAARHTNELVGRAKRLAEFPQMGRTVPELPGSELRELIEGRYRIVYRIRASHVEILTVFEGHRQLDAEGLKR